MIEVHLPVPRLGSLAGYQHVATPCSNACPVRVSIEGNIGAGKSSAVSSLMSRSHWHSVLEPVHVWNETRPCLTSISVQSYSVCD